MNYHVSEIGSTFASSDPCGRRAVDLSPLFYMITAAGRFFFCSTAKTKSRV